MRPDETNNPSLRYRSRLEDAFGQSKKADKTDAVIKQEIIKQSITSYTGSCPCPYSVDSVNGAGGRY
jgi:hypothetical protein